MSVLSTLKSLAKTALYHSGASTLLANHGKPARVLMYHGISSGERNAFVDQMTYLKRHFQVISLEAMIAKVSSGEADEHASIALTFDDGLRNNHEVVYPVLSSLDLSATFFVCPGLIDSGNWLWNHEARQRLESMAAGTRSELAGHAGAPAHETEAIVEWMKTLDINCRREVENFIRAASQNFAPSKTQHEQFDVMDWSEVRSMNPRLITIGSHTLSHPVLPTLEREDIEKEVGESRTILENRLGQPTHYFCYPNGGHDSRVVEAVRSKYQAAVTTDAGFVHPRDDLHTLRRIPSASYLPDLAWRLYRPEA